MEKIKTSEDLHSAIIKLELQRTQQYTLIKEDILKLRQNISPAHIIKSTVHDLANSTSFKQDAFKIAGGLATGLLTRGFVLGKGAGIGRKVLAFMLEVGAVDIFVKNADTLKTLGAKAVQSIFGARRKKTTD